MVSNQAVQITHKKEVLFDVQDHHLVERVSGDVGQVSVPKGPQAPLPEEVLPLIAYPEVYEVGILKGGLFHCIGLV